MGIACGDILKLSKLKELKLVAGSSGLERSVRWVYIAECVEDPNDIENWIFGNELVFITGHGLKGDTKSLLELVTKLSHKNISGLIINIGPYFSKIPEDVIELSNRISLPIFELPWQAKLVDITQEICSAIITKELEEKNIENLLESILFSRITKENDVIKHAMHYGINLESNCIVGILDIDNFSGYLKEKNISDEKKIIEIKNNLLRSVSNSFSFFSVQVICMIKSDSVIFLVNYTPYVKNCLENTINSVRKTIANRFPGLKVSAGIGNSYGNINEIRKSYRQAEQALKVSRCEYGGNHTCIYNNLGIYLLFLRIDDAKFLEEYYYDLFMPIIEYDKSTNSKLMETFQAFLNENCNMDNASKKLFIHKNTLKYRLQKVENLLTFDLNNMQEILKYDIGFKIGKFISE